MENTLPSTTVTQKPKQGLVLFLSELGGLQCTDLKKFMK